MLGGTLNFKTPIFMYKRQLACFPLSALDIERKAATVMHSIAIRAETCSCIGTAMLAMLVATLPAVVWLPAALVAIASRL